MGRKKIQYKQNTALFLACLSLLIFGACALFMNGGINYTSLVASCPTVLTAVGVMYVLGWLIGSTMEGSKSIKKTNLGYANNLLEEILKEEGLNSAENDSDYSINTDISEDDSLISGIKTESKE